MRTGWIKLHRKTTGSEWYTNVPAKVLAFHLLLTANDTPEQWHGVTIDRGMLVTSRNRLSAETGLSEREVRTALRVLTDCGFCTVEASTQASIITVTKFNEYQQQTRAKRATNETTNETTSKKRGYNVTKSGFSEISEGQTSNVSTNETTRKTSKKTTTIQEDKEINNYNNNNTRTRVNVPELLSDFEYLTSVAFGKEITVEQVRALIPEFVNQLVASGQTHGSESDIKTHFNNWVRRRVEMAEQAKQSNINAQKTSNNERTTNRRNNSTGRRNPTTGTDDKTTGHGLLAPPDRKW